MLLQSKSNFLMFLFIGTLLFVSCVKDVDFEQVDSFETTQRVDLDLLFFNLNTENFVDTTTQEVIPIVRDTTRLEFLDDDFIQDNLMEMDFLFEYEHTFSQGFLNRAVFLNEADEVLYETSFRVTPSQDGSATTTQYTEVITVPELDAIKGSIKLFIELSLEPNGQPIEGELMHKSKAIYTLVFSDL